MQYFDIIPPKKSIPAEDRGIFAHLHGWKKYATKCVVLLLMIGMNWAGISAVGIALAYYFDIESAGESVFAAGELDFSLVDGGWDVPEKAENLSTGASVSRLVTIADMVASSSVPFQYVADISQTGGDSAYCTMLHLDAFVEGAPVYNGTLLDFHFATTTFATTTSDSWKLTVSLPEGSFFPHPLYCNFDYTVSGGQAPFATSALGFHDEEKLSMAVRSSAQEPPICTMENHVDFDAYPTESGTTTIANGDVIDTEYSPWGLTVSGQSERRGPDVAIAFDSSDPTEGEQGFGTPNEDFGGPGKGKGGETGELGENNKAKGNVLMIPTKLKPDGRRGLSFDGYRGNTGTIFFTFHEPTYVESIRVLNNDGDKNSIKLYDEFGRVLRMVPIPNDGANSLQKVDLNTTHVSEMRVSMKKAAALDDLCFGKASEHATSTPIVLNEFLPNPEGKEYGHDFGRDSDHMPKGEWIEIYNNGTEPVDLSGWYVRNGSEGAGNTVAITAGNTDLGTTVIGGGGWLVAYMNKALFSNRGDSVRLYNGADVLVDAYEYGNAEFCDLEPTPGDENDEDGTGSCRGVPGNKSFARIPDGVGAWVDPIPTPGSENVAELSSSIEQTSFESTGEVVSASVPIVEETIEENVPFPQDEQQEVFEVATTTEIVEPELEAEVNADAPVWGEGLEIAVQSTEEEKKDEIMPEKTPTTKEEQPVVDAIVQDAFADGA